MRRCTTEPLDDSEGSLRSFTAPAAWQPTRSVVLEFRPSSVLREYSIAELESFRRIPDECHDGITGRRARRVGDRASHNAA